MIIYSVQCRQGHQFDEWFANSADFDVKVEAGEIACPDCGDRQVRKAITAARLNTSPSPEPPRCAGAAGCQNRACAYSGGA
jgi:hypothetical protein